MATMSKDEFIEEYGKIFVKFNNYYQCSFNFIGETNDGGYIIVTVGGNQEEINKMSIDAAAYMPISDLNPYSGYVFDKNELEVDSFYDSENN